MKLKIISDGNGDNTQILDAETGEALDNVVDCYIDISCGQPVIAYITVLQPQLEIIAEEAISE